MHKLSELYASYQRFRPFNDHEAWTLFRLAAIGEAVGWTLLLFGIICRDLLFPGNQVALQLGGRIHGMLFLGYIAAVLLLAPSLRWPFPKLLLAGLCSVPPYGSMLFEIIIGRQRRIRDFRRLLLAQLVVS